jgi:hypothetical protein
VQAWLQAHEAATMCGDQDLVSKREYGWNRSKELFFAATVFRSLCEGTWCPQPSPHRGRHRKKIVTVSLAQQQM